MDGHAWIGTAHAPDGVELRLMQRDDEFTILLDVDNGPDGLVRPDNDELYHRGGLHAAMAALRQGGILAVWSAHGDPAFTRRLIDAGFAVDQVTALETEHENGAAHVIWFAQKP